MCLGIPGEVIDIEAGGGPQAIVKLSGVDRVIDISLLDDVTVGDWVVVHLGFALAKIEPADAQALLRMLEPDPPANAATTA